MSEPADDAGLDDAAETALAETNGADAAPDGAADEEALADPSVFTAGGFFSSSSLDSTPENAGLADILAASVSSWKTQICTHFAMGSCYSGALCRFAHGRHELREKKSNWCTRFMQGTCTWGKECYYAHSTVEIQAVNRETEVDALAPAEEVDMPAGLLKPPLMIPPKVKAPAVPKALVKANPPAVPTELAKGNSLTPAVPKEVKRIPGFSSSGTNLRPPLAKPKPKAPPVTGKLLVVPPKGTLVKLASPPLHTVSPLKSADDLEALTLPNVEEPDLKKRRRSVKIEAGAASSEGPPPPEASASSEGSSPSVASTSAAVSALSHPSSAPETVEQSGLSPSLESLIEAKKEALFADTGAQGGAGVVDLQPSKRTSPTGGEGSEQRHGPPKLEPQRAPWQAPPRHVRSSSSAAPDPLEAKPKKKKVLFVPSAYLQASDDALQMPTEVQDVPLADGAGAEVPIVEAAEEDRRIDVDSALDDSGAREHDIDSLIEAAKIEAEEAFSGLVPTLGERRSSSREADDALSVHGRRSRSREESPMRGVDDDREDPPSRRRFDPDPESLRGALAEMQRRAPAKSLRGEHRSRRRGRDPDDRSREPGAGSDRALRKEAQEWAHLTRGSGKLSRREYEEALDREEAALRQRSSASGSSRRREEVPREEGLDRAMRGRGPRASGSSRTPDRESRRYAEERLAKVARICRANAVAAKSGVSSKAPPLPRDARVERSVSPRHSLPPDGRAKEVGLDSILDRFNRLTNGNRDFAVDSRVQPDHQRAPRSRSSADASRALTDGDMVGGRRSRSMSSSTSGSSTSSSRGRGGGKPDAMAWAREYSKSAAAFSAAAYQAAYASAAGIWPQNSSGGSSGSWR